MNELLTKTERRAFEEADRRKRMRTAVDLPTGNLREWMKKNMRCGTKRCPGCSKTISRTALSCLACATGTITGEPTV